MSERQLGSFGPGWFYSIFGVTVEFDNATPVVDDGEVFAIPWFSFNGQAYLYSGKESVVSGKITLTTYNKTREVWHGGIVVSIEEYIHTLDPYVSTEVKNFKTLITKEDIVKGTATYSFNFPLVLSKPQCDDVCKQQVSPYCTRHWCNTYNGTTFGIRHVFHVTVIRPWYTFSCQKHIFLSIHRMSPPVSHELNQNEMLTLNISGLKGNGKCSLKLNSDSLDISRGRDPSSYGRGGTITGGALSGSIRLSDLSEPVTSIVIFLIRRECVGDNVTNEKIELEHTVIGYVNSTIKTESGEEKTKEIPLSRGYWERLDLGDENPRDTDPVKHGTPRYSFIESLGLGSVISFEIPLDGYTNLPSGGNTNSIRGFSIFGDKNSHQYRIQHSLWNSLRIYQSFAYLPLLAPPGEFVPDSEDKPPSSGPASVERLDLEEIELSTSSSTVESPPPSLKPSGDVYTVHSVIPEESVSLRYLVRFCIQEASGKHLWNTQEITFYDSGMSTFPSYVDFVRSNSNSGNSNPQQHPQHQLDAV